MSFDWYRWAKSQTGLRPPEKAVLVCIADYYNDQEDCAWPSQETLAKDTSYNRSTIHRACKSLREKGLLSWEKNMRSSGHFSSNRYKLHRVAFNHTAESIAAEKITTVLPKATSPCCTEQQKPLAEPLDLTLNLQESTKENKKPSENQRKLARQWAVKLISRSREFYDLNEIIKDIEKFLMSDQSDESWKALGNGLPNPKELFGRP